MIDVHNHLIPGVDDGSRSVDESLLMIEQFIKTGYTGAIVTSHYDSGRYYVTGDMVREGISRLEQALKERRLDFTLYPGNEIQLDLKTKEDLKSDRMLSLNNSRYLLLEWPMFSKPHYAENLIYQLNLEGYIGVIAHPERYRYVREDPDFLLDFIKSGCLVQLNLRSLSEPGSVGETAEELLERNMVHLVGTDAHQSKWRNPLLGDELSLLKKSVGEGRFREMTEIRPKKIINDEFISSNYEDVMEKSKKTPKKKPRYKFW